MATDDEKMNENEEENTPTSEETPEEAMKTVANTSESKEKLFQYYLKIDDFKMAEKLIYLGVDPKCCPDMLLVLMHHFIDKKKEESVIKIIDAGVDRSPTVPGGDDSVLLRAASRGLFQVLKKLDELKDDLSVRDCKTQETALHLACKNGHFEIAEWLAEKVDVASKDKNAKVAYSYMARQNHLQNKSRLEKAFLLCNESECRSILRSLSAKDADHEVKMLKQKYKASRVAHLLYEVDETHYRNSVQIAVPSERAKWYEIDHLIQLFESQARPTAMLEERLEQIHNRLHFQGVPSDYASRIVFYKTIECAITHTLRAIHETPNGAVKDDLIKRTVDEYEKAVFECGGRLYATCCRQYQEAIRGRALSFEEEILDILAAHREQVLEAIVPEDQDSVHSFNSFLKHLGKELGIPAANMMQRFDDPYEPSFNRSVVRKIFKNAYNEQAILFDCIKQTIEQTSELRDKYIDWSVQNIPKSWKKEHFEKIVKEANEAADAKTYLEEQDIAFNTSIEHSIQDERKTQYLMEEVYTEEFKFKPAPIAHMLSTMKIFKPLHPKSKGFLSALLG